MSTATRFTYLAPGPKASSNPTTAAVGKTITISGSGFSAGETVKVTYKTGLHSPHPASVVLCSAMASSQGAFSCKGAVHRATSGVRGLHSIVARGGSSPLTASFPFKLT